MVAVRIPGADSIDPVAPARDPGVRADASDFGADIGASAEKMGATLTSLSAHLYNQRKTAEDDVYAQTYRVQAEPQLAQAAIDAKKAYPDGGPGFLEDLKQRTHAVHDQVTASLAANGYRPSDAAQQHVNRAFAGLQTNALVNGVAYDNNAQVAKLQTQTGENVKAIASQVLSGSLDVDEAIKQVDGITASAGSLYSGGALSTFKKQARDTVYQASIDSAIAAKDTARARELNARFFGDVPLPGQSKADTPEGADAVFKAIYAQESGSGRNTTTSVTGARGGMQIQPATFAQYAKTGENIDNPTDNLAVGRRIIEDLSAKAGGDPARIAVGYFSGPGNIAPPGSPTPWKVDKADPTGKTVSSYVSDVMRRIGSAESPNVTVALTNNSKINSADGVNRADMQSAVNDDLASMQQTGQGDPNLTADKVALTLGPNAAADWQTARNRAKAFYDNTQDFYALPDNEINARLESLRPKPGQEEFIAQQKLFEEAQKKADKIRVARQDDPASSVAMDPQVKIAAQGATFDDPAKLQPLITARLAAQDRAGIPPDAQSPITRAEALTLTVPLRRMLPGQERQTLKDMGDQFKELFGANADTAFAYALRVHKVDAATAQAAARVVKKLGLGEVPNASDTQAADSSAELAAADKAVGDNSSFVEEQTAAIQAGAMPTASPQFTGTSGANVPIRAIRDLRADPKLAGDFDAKYGKGTSKKILNNYPVVR